MITRISRNFHLILWIFTLISGIVTKAVASESFARSYNLTSISLDNGLPHGFVDDVFKDSSGFLWLSLGGGGLCRYDGYSFLKLSPDSQPCTVRSIFVKKSVEDDHHRLWVATAEGIDIIDLYSMTNRQVDNTLENSDIFNEDILNILKDSQGNIWVRGVNSWIARVTLDKNGNIRNIVKFSHPGISGQAIAEISNSGKIWIGIDGKIHNVYIDNDRIIVKPVSEALTFSASRIFNCFVRDGENVWIGTDWGLFRYTSRTKALKHFTYDPADSHSLSQNYVLDVVPSSATGTPGDIVIVSTLQGLNILDITSGQIERVDGTTLFNSGNSIGSNFINSVCHDSGILHVATEGAGMKTLSPKSLYVSNFSHSNSDNTSLSSNIINAIHETDDGTLWIGTIEGGFNRLNPDSDTFTHYNTGNSGLCHNSVSAISSDRNNRLWVGTWGGGIDIFELLPDPVLVSHIDNAHFPPLAFTGSLIYDPINDGMWIGSIQGLYFMDISTGNITRPFSEFRSDSISGCIGAVIDGGGNLWQGSSSGLYVIDLHSRQNNHFSFRHLATKLDNHASKATERVSCLFIDDSGTLWVGSNGFGLYRRTINDGKEEFKAYTTDDGLPNNTVRGLLQDKDGYLWVATNNGLARMNTPRETFEIFDTSTGLCSNSFYWNATLADSNGDLYFGTGEGLTRIKGMSPSAQRHSSPRKVVFTSLSVNNENDYSPYLPENTDITHARDIYLHESDRSITINFSALDYGKESGTYQYMLDGWDKKWITDRKNRHSVSYSSLPSGNYTLKVRYISENNTEEAPVSEIAVHIKPFFYKSMWFGMLLIAVTVGAIIAFNTWRSRKYRLEHSNLEREVTRRTAEIEAQKRQLEAMTVDRISFFTNITHEFRTPITLIMGPIQRALKLSYNPQVIEQLQLVERNSRYLLSLVNQLMDFRKVESGKMEVHNALGNFPEFLHDLIIPFNLFAKERHITITELSHISSPELGFDGDCLRKVITNLISNALKFTPDNGNITIYSALIPASDGNTLLYIGVHDTGTGIDEKDIPFVFDRFYQGKSTIKYPVFGSSGSGIGLYLCKEIITMLGGNISVNNGRKGGCVFRFTVPVLTETSDLQADASPASKEAQESLPSSITTVSDHTTILVVEDNADMRRYICSILKERYDVIEASDGKTALSLLSSRPVDFIITDLMMPGMDGLELSRRIKENFAISHIPILMLTAKTARESRIESYRIGVDEYLMKPFDEEILIARIENILARRQRYQTQFGASMNVENLNIEEESRDSKFMRQVIEVMQSNYSNSYFDIGDFSEAMGISRSLLNKKLQSLSGQSAAQFIRSYRLNVAKELIVKNRKTKSLNIAEIAYEVGFNDSKYFTRCFSAHFKITPSAMMGGADPAN